MSHPPPEGMTKAELRDYVWRLLHQIERDRPYVELGIAFKDLIANAGFVRQDELEDLRDKI